MSLDRQDAFWIDTINELVDLSREADARDADSRDPLAAITRLARRLLGSHACTLTRVDEMLRQLTTVACEGPDPVFEQAMRGRRTVLETGGRIDPHVVARGEVVERYGLPQAGQGVASEAMARRYDLQAVLCQPLIRRSGTLIGYINHFSSSNEPFAPLTRRLLDMFGRQVVAGVERIGEQTFDRAFKALNQLSQNLQADSHDFLKQAADTACQLLSVPACVIWQYAEHEEKLTIVGGSDTVDPAFRRIVLDRHSPGLQHVIASRDVRTMSDIRKPSRFYQHSAEAAERGWVSLITAPMLVADRLTGILDLYTASPRRFEAWEKKFFGVFANFVALAITTFTHRRRLEKLNRLMLSMTEAKGVDEVLRLFLDGGLELLGETRGWISRVDLRTGELRIHLHAGDPPSLRTLKWGEGITGRAVKRGHPLNIPDVAAARWQRTYVPFWPDTRSELAVPIMLDKVQVRKGTSLRLGRKPIGVLNIESPRGHAFTEASARLMWSLAQHAAVVIEKLEFDEQFKKLEEIERDMGQLGSFDETARTVLEAVHSLLGYDFVNISLVKPEARTIKTEYVLGDPQGKEEEFKRMAEHSLDGKDIQADIVRKGVAEVPHRNDPRFDPEIYNRFRHVNLVRVFVPMRLPQRDSVIGTIEAGYNQPYRRFIYEREVTLLQGFADYAALALEHKKLAGFNLYLAAILKESLGRIGATQGSLLLLSADQRTLEVIEAQGRPYRPGQVYIEVGTGVAGIAVRDRQPMRVPDIQKSDDFVPASGGEPTFRSMLAVPLLLGDRCIGAICANGDAVDQFTQDDEDNLVDIAQDVAPIVDQLSVEAFIAYTRRLNQLERFRAVSEELTRIRDLTELRVSITHFAQSLLGAHSAVLYEYHEDTDSFDVPPTLSDTIRNSDAMRGAVDKDRAPYLIVRSGATHYAETSREDVVMRGPSASPFVEREGVFASAGVLLRTSTETVGVLFLNYYNARDFPERDRHVIGGFAVAAALALKEARAVQQAVQEAVQEGHQSALVENRFVMAHRCKGPLSSMERRLTKICERSTQPYVRYLAVQASQLNSHLQNLIAEFNTSAQHPFFERLKPISRDALAALLLRVLTSNKTRDETRVRVVVAPSTPDIWIDYEGLEDDFIGLLHDSERHASEVTDVSEVSIDVGSARAEDLRRWNLVETQAFVKFAYRDNGPGVRPEHKELIFDPKFTTAEDGTGLGLYITRTNAHRYGGNIYESGTYGEGVIFELYIPVDRPLSPTRDR